MTGRKVTYRTTHKAVRLDTSMLRSGPAGDGFYRLADGRLVRSRPAPTLTPPGLTRAYKVVPPVSQRDLIRSNIPYSKVTPVTRIIGVAPTAALGQAGRALSLALDIYNLLEVSGVLGDLVPQVYNPGSTAPADHTNTSTGDVLGDGWSVTYSYPGFTNSYWTVPLTGTKYRYAANSTVQVTPYTTDAAAIAAWDAIVSGGGSGAWMKKSEAHHRYNLPVGNETTQTPYRAERRNTWVGHNPAGAAAPMPVVNTRTYLFPIPGSTPRGRYRAGENVVLPAAGTDFGLPWKGGIDIVTGGWVPNSRAGDNKALGRVATFLAFVSRGMGESMEWLEVLSDGFGFNARRHRKFLGVLKSQTEFGRRLEFMRGVVAGTHGQWDGGRFMKSLARKVAEDKIGLHVYARASKAAKQLGIDVQYKVTRSYTG